MGDINFKKTKGNILKGKGFYIALSLCLVGAIGAAYVAISSTFDDIKNPDIAKNSSSSSEVNSEWGFNQDKEAGKNQSNLPITSSSSTTSSNSQLSSSSSTTSSKRPSSQTASATQGNSQNQLFSLPISSEVLNKFSGEVLVMDKTMNDYRTHNGVDLKAKVGTQVKSVADGTVTKIYEDAMWGTVMEITHKNDVVSIYTALNNTTTVKVNDKVKLGQVIGATGETALAEVGLEPHLHLEIKQAGKNVDPIAFIEASKKIKK